MTATPITPKEQVSGTIKTLSWKAEGQSHWYGKDINDRFHYTVMRNDYSEIGQDDDWSVFIGGFWKTYPDLEAAKAAAQADYDARILAAIQPDPEPQQRLSRKERK